LAHVGGSKRWRRRIAAFIDALRDVTIDNETKFARRPWRTLIALLVAVAASYWVGRQFGLDHGELVGYLLASIAIVVGAGFVALLLFGAIRLFRR
jgi:hypothetical protein